MHAVPLTSSKNRQIELVADLRAYYGVGSAGKKFLQEGMRRLNWDAEALRRQMHSGLFLRLQQHSALKITSRGTSHPPPCAPRRIRRAAAHRGFRRSGSCDFASQSSSLRSSANLTPSAQANPATEQCEARQDSHSCRLHRRNFGIMFVSREAHVVVQRNDE